MHHETQRAILLTFVLFNAYFSVTGIVFGWAAMYDILKDDGQYAEGCNVPSNSTSGHLHVSCASQDSKLQLIATVAFNMSNVATVIFGFTLTWYGVMLNSFVGSGLFSVGCVLAAYSDSTSFNAFIPAFALISFGGMGVFLPSFQFSNLLSRPTLFLTIKSALYTVSAITFTWFDLIHDHLHVSRRTLFLVYACVVAVCSLLIAALYPILPYQPGDKTKLPILEGYVWKTTTDQNTHADNKENNNNNNNKSSKIARQTNKMINTQIAAGRPVDCIPSPTAAPRSGSVESNVDSDVYTPLSDSPLSPSTVAAHDSPNLSTHTHTNGKLKLKSKSSSHATLSALEPLIDANEIDSSENCSEHDIESVHYSFDDAGAGVAVAVDVNANVNSDNSPVKVADNRTLKSQICEPVSWFLAVYFGIGLLYMNYYNTTISAQLEGIGGHIEAYNTAFIFVISLLPLPLIPFLDAMVVNLSYSGTSFVTTVLTCATFLPLLFPHLYAQVFGFALYSIARQLLVTILFNFIPAYYKQETYGMMVAFMVSICTLIGFLQFVMQYAASEFGYQPVNIACMVSFAPFLYFSLFLKRMNL